MDAQSQPFESTQAEGQTLDTSRLYQDGFIAGTIGAGTIALWFLILDLIKGRPLFTPSILGTALFKGVGALGTSEALAISPEMVIWYTFVHWLVFALVGCAASRLLGSAERNPNLGFGILLLFVVFEFGFLAVVTIFARPVLAELAWPTVLIGNLLAAVTMGLYFWRRHPHLIIYP